MGLGPVGLDLNGSRNFGSGHLSPLRRGVGPGYRGDFLGDAWLLDLACWRDFHRVGSRGHPIGAGGFHALTMVSKLKSLMIAQVS